MNCSVFFWWQAITIVILNASVEVILLARVYVVYNCNKLVIYVLSGRGLPSLASLTGCSAPTTLNHFLAFAFVPPIVVESILCFCVLYKAWITYKNEYGSPLLKQLIQDSVRYFCSTFVVMSANLLVMSLASPGFMAFAFGWQYAVPCCIGSRLLLSMFGRSGKQPKPSPHSFMLSDMRMWGSSRNTEPSVVAVSDRGSSIDIAPAVPCVTSKVRGSRRMSGTV
ncbi:hypothetical protein JB92DRAFT_1080305 [Gautieria morchelliformis]|nr:hypothetical protein JB92DRAFT_1080305 [Gautieria morchelliformis]